MCLQRTQEPVLREIRMHELGTERKRNIVVRDGIDLLVHIAQTLEVKDERPLRDAEHRREISACRLHHLLQNRAACDAALRRKHLCEPESALRCLGVVHGDLLPRIERAAPLQPHNLVFRLQELKRLTHRRPTYTEHLTQLPLARNRREIRQIGKLFLHRIADLLVQRLFFARHECVFLLFYFCYSRGLLILLSTKKSLATVFYLW